MRSGKITGFLLGLTLAFGMGLGAVVPTALMAQPEPFEEAVIGFREPASAEVIASLARLSGARIEPNSIYARDGRVFRVRFAPEQHGAVYHLFARLVKNGLVAFAEPNPVYHATGFPNDPLYDKQWNLRAIGIENAWQRADGEGAVVAVIDTGVARGLPDLAETGFVTGYDFVNDDNDATDDQGHGSHVAGTIAQSTDNGIGVAGIAYRARIMPVKVLDRYGSGTALDVADGIRYAADHGAHVINLSLGGSAGSTVMRDAVDYARRKGVVVVCAAGNESAAHASYPAAYDSCLAVSATGPSGALSFYSNYGQNIDLSAPGGDKTGGEEGGVLQNTIDPDGNPIYASYQGTSMAAPHVAGVAALLYGAGMRDGDLIRKALLSSSRPVGHDLVNQHGAGQLNAEMALATLDQPWWFFRGGVRWLVPLAVLAAGSLLGAIAYLGRREHLPGSLAYLLGFALAGPGLFPLTAFGTLWGPENLLLVLSTPLPDWDRLFFGGFFNPALHSVLMPAIAAILLAATPLRPLAAGLAVGTAALLALQGTVFFTPLGWFSDLDHARIYLLVNALLSLVLGFALARGGEQN